MSSSITCTNGTQQNEVMVLHYTIPAVVLLILHVYVRVRKQRHEVHAPYNPLQNNDRNRYLIAVAFGYVAFQLFGLIGFSSGRFFASSTKTPAYFAYVFLVNIILATLTGFAEFPIFVLLNSPYTLVSSTLGIIFVVWKICYNGLRFQINCSTTTARLGLSNSTERAHRAYRKRTMEAYIPAFIFLSILLGTFCRRIYFCWKRNCTEIPVIAKSVIRGYQLLHLEQLFQQNNRQRRDENEKKSCCAGRVRNTFKPWFNFPTEILLSTSVIVVLLYVTALKSQDFIFSYSNSKGISKSVILTSLLISLLIYALLLLHFMYRVQQDCFAMYKGQNSLVSRDDKNFNKSVLRSLWFPGYLMAAMFYGFLTIIFVVTILVVVVDALVQLPWTTIEIMLQYFATIFLIPLSFVLVQKLLVRFVLTDSDLSKQSINIKHAKMYHVISFFLIFFNIIMGIFGALKRSLLAFVMTLLFLGRVDKNPLMFFKSLDGGHNAYLGFLRVQATFKNPAMRCFCQILLEPDIGHVACLTTQDNTLAGAYSSFRKGDLTEDRAMYQADSRVARNRWHLVYTLLNNPQLKQYRSHNQKVTDQSKDTQLPEV